MREYSFIAHDGRKIICSLWDGVKNPIGVVQIIHGMDEHIARYDRFAKYLNRHGYIVFGDDHRAHGRTAGTPDKIGRPDGDADLFSATVSDELEIVEMLKNRYALPLLLFGHSYGSFITQALMERTNLPAAGVCLSGSARYPMFGLAIARIISWAGCRMFGADAPARIIEYFSPVRTRPGHPSKLTRDTHQVALHDADKMRAKYFSYGFYFSLFKNLMRLNQTARADMPLLIISGSRDLVSANSRLSIALYREYQAHGLNDVTIIVYPAARHELLMELNYRDVQRDVLDFFNSVIK